MKDIVVALLNFVTKEKRGWVIVLLSILILSVLFRAEIKRVINFTDPVAEQAHKSDFVNEELYKILKYSTADRVYIFQFHNGVMYYNGQHAQRFTCTYEIVRDGISRLSPEYVNMQVSVFSWLITTTLEGNMCFVDVEDVPDFTTRYILERKGVKSIRMLPIIKNNKIIGIIGMDYVKNRNPFLADPIAKEWFENEAKLIADILG